MKGLWLVKVRVGNLRILNWVVCATSSESAGEKAKKETRKLYMVDYQLAIQKSFPIDNDCFMYEMEGINVVNSH